MPHLAIFSLNRDPCGAPGEPNSGGQVKYILGLVRHLVHLGWTIDIVTAQWKRNEPTTEITTGVEIYRLALPAEVATIDDLDVLGCWTIAERALSLDLARPDISLSCYWQSMPCGLLMRSRNSVPATAAFCSLGHFKREHLLRQQIPEPWTFIERIELETRAIREMDAIIATSETEKATLIREYGAIEAAVHVIPRGIDFEYFPERLSNSVSVKT